MSSEDKGAAMVDVSNVGVFREVPSNDLKLMSMRKEVVKFGLMSCCNVYSEGHNSCVSYMRLSADGTKLYTIAMDCKLIAWDAATLSILAEMQTPMFPDWVSLSPDGNKMAVVGFQNVSLLDFTTYTVSPSKVEEKGKSIHACHVFADNQRVLVEMACEIQIRELETLKLQSVLMPKGTYSFKCCTITPDETRLLLGGHDGSLIVWDIESKREIAKIAAHTKKITSIYITPDGSKIVTCSEDSTAKAWDLLTDGFAELGTLEVKNPSAICGTKDGSKLLLAAKDRGNGTVVVFDVKTFGKIGKIVGLYGIKDMLLNKDETILYVGEMTGAVIALKFDF